MIFLLVLVTQSCHNQDMVFLLTIPVLPDYHLGYPRYRLQDSHRYNLYKI